jgi:ribonuclease HI
MIAEKLIINADGASRHNPGPAAIGATIKDTRGRLVASISKSIGRATNNQAEYKALIAALEKAIEIGRATNNQAEYKALIAALEKAIEIGARQVDIQLDSELVVKQMKGRYRVKNAVLRPLYLRAGELLSQIESFTISNVPREQNAEADRLANKALTRGSVR